jgi:hypothetical protein
VHNDLEQLKHTPWGMFDYPFYIGRTRYPGRRSNKVDLLESRSSSLAVDMERVLREIDRIKYVTEPTPGFFRVLITPPPAG